MKWIEVESGKWIDLSKAVKIVFFDNCVGDEPGECVDLYMANGESYRFNVQETRIIKPTIMTMLKDDKLTRDSNGRFKKKEV